MTIIIAVLILLVSSCISGEIDYIKKSFFSSCDRNSDKQIDKEELDSCILDIPTPQTVLNMIDRRAEFIMGLFDKNKDGSLSLSEYLDDSVATARDRNVRVTTRAGEVKELSQDDFMEMMKERDPFGTLIGKNGPRREGNQMIQEEEGSSMYEDLMTAKTDLGNLVRIGNWTHQQLRKIGHANGTMVNLKNLPDGGTSALSDKHEIATFSGRNFTVLNIQANIKL